MAEVIYIQKGVYSVGREKIKQSLLHFLSEVNVVEPEVLKLGIETYEDSTDA